ncbi:MAG: glycosyltransferase family 4 protein [Actinomycetia bacterium]|nr:glycosyltransferase family 4 protein [Actinomycetes bacterium]
MRIGMVCPYSLTIPGGVQGQVLDLSRALRAEGAAVRILAPCDGPPPATNVTPLGASLPYATNGSVAPIAPDLPAQLRLIRAMRDEDFDIINIHEPLAPGVSTTALLVKAAPLFGTFHAAGDEGPYRPFAWTTPVLGRMLRRLDKRVAVSADAAELASRHFGGDYELVFNAVAAQRIIETPPWSTSGPTVFFIARHEPRKGLAVLLESLEHLPADVQVWVAGDGPQTEELQQRFPDPRVEWLGRISDDEKFARLRGADLFCVPSLGGESFGVVLLEGMAAATPVVASGLDAYAAVARQGADAELFRPGDPAHLAVAIRRVLDDERRRAELVESGLERAGQFSMRALARRYLDLFEATVASAARQGSRWDRGVPPRMVP